MSSAKRWTYLNVWTLWDDVQYHSQQGLYMQKKSHSLLTYNTHAHIWPSVCGWSRSLNALCINRPVLCLWIPLDKITNKCITLNSCLYCLTCQQGNLLLIEILLANQHIQHLWKSATFAVLSRYAIQFCGMLITKLADNPAWLRVLNSWTEQRKKVWSSWFIRGSCGSKLRNTEGK